MTFNVAVVGATGNVGREMLRTLCARNFPLGSIAALASERSRGTRVEFDAESLEVQGLDGFDFAGIDIALFAAGSAVSRQWAESVCAAGATVIDNASCFRMREDVPLVVPEVNGALIADGAGRGRLIANPNCSTAQLVLALKPLHDRAGIRRVCVATYQSVSGAGKAAMDELFEQTRSVFNATEVAPLAFAKRIAFNVLPQVGEFMEDGQTGEEWKMCAETSKIMGAEIPLTATCVRVPVFIGHGEAVNVELEEALDVDEAREVLRTAPGCRVVDVGDEGDYATPVECAGEGEVFISRIRRDASTANGLNLWVVADNLLKGAALNAVQIAELVCGTGAAPRA